MPKPMNHKERIKLEMTFQDIILSLSDGVVGAARVLVDLMTRGDSIDQAAAMGGGVATLLNLDMASIYGSNIWILYKDICGENLENMMAVLRANQLGIINDEDVWAAIDEATGGRYGKPEGKKLDVAALLAQVKERLGDDWVSPDAS